MFLLLKTCTYNYKPGQLYFRIPFIYFFILFLLLLLMYLLK